MKFDNNYRFDKSKNPQRLKCPICLNDDFDDYLYRAGDTIPVPGNEYLTRVEIRNIECKRCGHIQAFRRGADHKLTEAEDTEAADEL